MNGKRTNRLAIVSALMAFGLAACEGPKATPEVLPLLTPAPPSPPALGRPAAPAAPQTVHSSVSEKTRVDADGTVRTTRTSTSVTFNPDKATAAVDGLISAAARPADGSIPGTWTSRSSSNGATCSVTLFGDPAAIQGAASSSCPYGASMLAGSSAWRYADGMLTLYKGSEVAMVFHRAGPHHYAGTAKWGFLTTTIRLTR